MQSGEMSVWITWMSESGVTVTVTLTVVEWVSAPDVPVIDSAYVPGVTKGPKFTVIAVAAESSAGGVTGLVANETVKPATGGVGALRVTAELNSSRELTVAV